MLTDIGNVGFKVENFNHENMVILENHWPDSQTGACMLTVRLLASFGFNGQNLRAAQRHPADCLLPLPARTRAIAT